MKKYIPLYTDLQFKNLFGNEKNKKYTESLLENILGLEEGYLKYYKIENSVNLTKEVVENKRLKLDVILRTKIGDTIRLTIRSVFNEESKVKNTMYIVLVYGTNILKDLKIQKKNKLIECCCLTNKEDSSDKILEEELNFVIANINVNTNYEIENKMLKDWIELTKAATYEEAKNAVSGNKLLEEELKEMERFANNEYVQA